MEERVEQVQQVKQNTNKKLSKYEGLAATLAAELMIGFWLEIGALLAIKMVSSLGELISR